MQADRELRHCDAGGQRADGRAAALAAYGILDTDPEGGFEDLVHLAALICKVPISTVTFIDSDRQWFKAELGLGVRETELEVSFCAHAADGTDDAVFVVPDARIDERFRTNRLVTGAPNVRFYAGAPIRDPAGVALGAMCVIDRRPRHLDGSQIEALQALSRQATALLEARKAAREVAVAAQAREAALAEAMAAGERLRAVFAGSPLGIVLTDVDGTIEAVNESFADMVGIPADQLVGVGTATLRVPGDAAAEADFRVEALAGERDTAVCEEHYRHADGHSVPATSIMTVIRDEGGTPSAFLSQVQSIEERRRAEEALLETQSAHDGIVTVDHAGLVVAWNAGAERLFGRPASAMRHRPLSMVIPADSPADHPAVLPGAADSCSQLRLLGVRADGTEFPIEMSVSSWTRAERLYHTAIIRDVSEREALHAQLLAEATTDPLTRVGNRAALTAQVKALLDDRTAGPVSVVAMDIDAFTQINATLGATAGDRVLVAVARALAAVLRPGEGLARIGSDEFAVALSRTTRNQATAVAGRLRDALRQVQVRGVPLQLDICAGIATSQPTQHAATTRSANGLLRNATLALDTAKSTGAGSVHVYQRALARGARRRLAIHGALQEAVERGELTVAYQPQVDLNTGRVRAVEALARWAHPKLGRVGPDEFIPISETSGLIGPLGAAILTAACTQAAEWRRHPGGRIGLSVNVSVRQLADDTLLDLVDRALGESGLTANDLTLEITESTLLASSSQVSRRLGALKRLGVRLAVDDFGTGYSSLASLTNFPPDELKIDRSFVAPLPDDIAAQRIITTVIALADGLQLSTVSEGVETADQHQLLRRLGCHLGQGFLFAKPLPAQDIPALLTSPLRLLHGEAG